MEPRALDTIRQSLPQKASAALDVLVSPLERKLIVCACRLSQEKNPLYFVEMMRCGALRKTIADLGLIPVLCGAAAEEEYAEYCRALLLESYPNAVIIDDFLGPEELASIFAHSVVNFHPSRYDAFGMTIIEAAVFGAPSIINCRDVGATELLGEDAYLPLDMNLPTDELAIVVSNILSDKDRLEAVQKASYQKAIDWNEDASGEVILERLKALAYESNV